MKYGLVRRCIKACVVTASAFVVAGAMVSCASSSSPSSTALASRVSDSTLTEAPATARSYGIAINSDRRAAAPPLADASSLPPRNEEIWVIERPRTKTSAPDDQHPGCGSLVACIPDLNRLPDSDPVTVPVPLKRTEVNASIVGAISTVEVTQQFVNPFSNKIEAVYVFPLPENAAVNEFIMTVGDRHIHGAGYRNYRLSTHHSGRYSVITAIESETPADFERLRKLPMIRDIVFMNSLVLPATLESDGNLRSAAAALHADMLFIYTFDTTFTNDDFASPLMVVTLGLFPGTTAKVSTTASGLLLDTRTGYIYAVATGHSKKSQLANAWTSKEEADDARLRAESDAFKELVTGIEQTWPKLMLDSANWSARAAEALRARETPRGPLGNTYWTVPGN